MLLYNKLLFAFSTLLFISACHAGAPSKIAGKSSNHNGLVAIKSAHNVATTADRLESVLKSKGMTVFSRIDHAENAKKVGLDLNPTQVILFGNPKVGTRLMQCEQTIAIDLPQKALIWKDDKGTVWLSYNDPMYLADRHAITGCSKVLEKISMALGNFAKKATSAK
ncbi:MAG: hypothetical protein COA42_21245 [Alteromonadaceae bacterium]|nr:MAG: hypothetical protein COA42_21245 [Alteromonadaceae bacterium]